MQKYADIRIIGAIDDDTFEKFCEDLDSFLEKYPNTPYINVHLTSGGGSPYVALAFIDRMRVSGLKFNITAFGHASSAATIILAAGNHRVLSRESLVLVHEDSDEIAGTVSQIERQVRNLRKLEDRWNQLMEKFTKKPAVYWDKLHAKGDTWLTPEQCLELGIIDEII